MRTIKILLPLLLLFGTAHAADIYVSPAGADSNDGSSATPKQTIQAAVSIANPGDRVIVGAGTYKEPYPNGAESYLGIHITRSGIQGSPITIMSEQPGAAIIDQGFEAAGFVLWAVSDVTISGFTIRNCKAGGVYMTHDQAKQRIVVDGNVITGCDGDANSNVGGIYMSSCTECTISNNVISSIRVGGLRNLNGAGIHGYDQEYSVIEGNTISDAFDGIYHKKSTGRKGLIIRRNVIRDVEQGIWYSISAVGNPPHIEQEVYENVIQASISCIRGSGDETSPQSNGLAVTNNVFVGCGAGVLSRGFLNLSVRSNIFHNVGDAIVTQYGAWRDELVTESNNLFSPGVSITLQQYAAESRFADLSAWNSFSGFGTGDLVGDPLFTAPDSLDFTLQPGSPAIGGGHDGRDIGAFPGAAGAQPMAPVLSIQ
jgi:parallel beta-helix repeat protein